MADAWDDDWIKKADSKPATPDSPSMKTKLSKAERRARQAEFNRQIWEDAEKEDDNFFLKTQGVIPLKSEFKPTMKVLSRKPAAKTPTAVEGMGQLTLEDDDEDEDASKDLMTPEERQRKAQREREEKQKAYEERRKELFGKDRSEVGPSSGRKNDSPRNQSRVKYVSESRPSSAASNKSRQLYDPNQSAKAEHLRMQKKDFQLDESQPIREPKPPSSSGRGGFGFASRGRR